MSETEQTFSGVEDAEDHESVAPEDLTDAEEPTTGSLQDRMQERRSSLEQITTEVFDVPRWSDILAVELKYLGYKTMRSIAQKHQRVKDPTVSEMRVAADHLLRATVGFYEVKGEKKVPAEGMTWLSLARSVIKLPEDASPRVALVGLVGDTQTVFLWQEWQEWMKGERVRIDTEVGRDFQTTP